MRTKGCSRNYADTLHGNCFWFLKQHNNFGNIITFVQMQDLRIGPTTTQSRSKFLIHFCAAEIVYSCPHSALLTLTSHNRIEPSHGLLHSFWAGETWEQLAIRSEWGQIGNVWALARVHRAEGELLSGRLVPPYMHLKNCSPLYYTTYSHSFLFFFSPQKCICRTLHICTIHTCFLVSFDVKHEHYFKAFCELCF